MYFSVFKIATFYKFVSLDNIRDLQEKIRNSCKKFNLKGTILLATEGINATIAGNEDNIIKFLDFLTEFSEFSDLEIKYSQVDFCPFQKLKVRLKREIIKMGSADLKITATENYVAPEDWDELLEDDRTIVIDVRNDYEIKFGKFADALEPEIENFHEFPAWFDGLAHDVDLLGKRIAMYCTGGVRCEKSVSYLKKCGFNNVFHLRGGILAYLEKNKEKKSWQGECFVFDDRVSITKELTASTTLRCNICSAPANHYGQPINLTKGKVLCKICQEKDTYNKASFFA